MRKFVCQVIYKTVKYVIVSKTYFCELLSGTCWPKLHKTIERSRAYTPDNINMIYIIFKMSMYHRLLINFLRYDLAWSYSMLNVVITRIFRKMSLRTFCEVYFQLLNKKQCISNGPLWCIFPISVFIALTFSHIQGLLLVC